ncbi:hypothetical protein Q6D67_13050 [Haliea sp. E1-2-M8]|uniref:hypothetical protein n=1 Tax=Haliea sp. E1-2-M8 TaxID=3064706 RepID=UPI002722C697|nr:hypothetical protein [Haliea sp. E1-2-M8]MDO8862631.1 hypothetical protein [Haliea sp. E1-2-M8]
MKALRLQALLLTGSLLAVPLFADQQQQDAIALLESEHGAYSAVLPERLLSLGLSLQQEGRHGEAAAVFKRGTHLARVTTGLYSTEQLPLLESEIRSLLALGDYRAVDERQRYLFRVQERALQDPGQRAGALLQQADWQRQAYLLRLDEDPAQRLLQMWELNRLALNDILEEEGDTSITLLQPLYGMLQAQYLISDLQWQDGPGFSSSHGFSEQPSRPRPGSYRKDNYKKGMAVLKAIHDLERMHSGRDPSAPARALTMLGDWMLWHGEREAAVAVYREAIGELAGHADAQPVAAELFADPVALPAVAGLDEQGPLSTAGGGDILLEFAVSADGKVEQLHRVDDTGEANGFANRLMRKLRNTPFRPRFDLETGEPVDTENLIVAYDSKS